MSKEKEEIDNSKKCCQDDNSENKYKELENKYKRALADYQNLIKQTTKEKQEFVKYANEQFLYEILPVYDNLKMALSHSDKKNDKWIEGVNYVVKQFKTVLESAGIEEIKTIGEKFDHNTMEAVEGRGETVKQEARPGYKLRGKVIAPAKVILE
jgi:molecular chaperone GrpE